MGSLVLSVIFVLLALTGVYFIVRPVEVETRDGIVKWPSRAIGAFVAVLFGGMVLISSVASVGATEVGVPITLGHPGSSLSPGPHLVLPWTNVKTLDVKTQVMNLDDDNEVKTITSDRIQTPVDISVYFSVDKTQAPNLLLTVGEDYADKIVKPLVRSTVYDQGSLFSSEAIQNKRDDYETAVFNQLKPIFAARGIILEKFEIRKIQLPDSILTNAQAKINAEEAQKRAKIDAETLIIQTQAQADANDILASSIKNNPAIICANFVEGLRKGEITAPVYVNPCGGPSASLLLNK